MPISNPFNPMSSGSALVDQLIGKSYEVVATVFDNLAYIKTVATNITAVKHSANNLHRSIASLTGEMADLGETVLIPLPEEISAADVLDYNVLLLGSDNALYTPAEGYFSTRLVAGELEITLANDAPNVLIEAEVRWTLSYRD